MYLSISLIEKSLGIALVLTKMPYWFIELSRQLKQIFNEIQLFHTDRGNEFKNKLIDEALETFKIKRSLSMKGCPYDNAVAEATFKIIKTEFVKGRHFDKLRRSTT